jgi:hypothetical protein
MARIRTVKPELFQSYTIKRLSLEARWTFVGLLTHVDDDGYCRDEPRIIKGAIWPLEDDVSWSDVEKHIDELLHAGLACRFYVNGVPHLHIVNFREHQTINRPTKSRLPHCPNHAASPPPEGVKPAPFDAPPALFTEESVTPHAPLTEDSCTEVEVEVERERELETEQEETPTAPVSTQPVDNFVPDSADADKPRGAEITKTPAAKKPKRAKRADPDAADRDEAARKILQWWWDQQDPKPAGEKAWFAGLATIKALLKAGHDRHAICVAVADIGSPLTIPRMEIQLGRIAGTNVIQLPAQRQSTADQRAAQAHAAAAEVAAELAQGVS